MVIGVRMRDCKVMAERRWCGRREDLPHHLGYKVSYRSKKVFCSKWVAPCAEIDL